MVESKRLECVRTGNCTAGSNPVLSAISLRFINQKMKTTIIYASYHHNNTEKVAEEINSVLNANLVPFFKANTEMILEADLVGFGSGVYYNKFHKSLIQLVESLPNMQRKKTFLFSTAGIKKNIILNNSHNHFKKIIKKKNFDLIAEFECLGFDTNGLLEKIGGINKGRPNDTDFEKAKEFARGLVV